jgi:hypothetical protein
MDGSSMESCVSSNFIRTAMLVNIAKAVGAKFELAQTRPTNALECDYSLTSNVNELIPSSVTNYFSKLVGPLSTGLLGTVGGTQFPSNGLGSGVHLTTFANSAKMYSVR